MSANDDKPRFVPFGITRPANAPHAAELSHSKALRKDLRDAKVIVALWPDHEELLFGGDYLTYFQAMGNTEVPGVLCLRVETEAHMQVLVAAIDKAKPMTFEQWKTMQDNSASGGKDPRKRR